MGVHVSLLPVLEACVVVAVHGRVGEVRVPADEPEAVDLDPGVLARRPDAPATVKAVLEQAYSFQNGSFSCGCEERASSASAVGSS